MKKSFSRQLFNLFTIVLVVKFVETVQRLVITYKFGISDYSDIYWALISIPDLIIVLTGFNTLNGVVNSQYSSLYSNNEKEKIEESFSNLFSLLLIVGISVIILILVFNQYFVRILLPGFDNSKFRLAVTFSLIIFPIFFFKSFTVFFTTVLNSYKVFVFPTVMQLLLPLLVLISAFLPYLDNQLIYNLSYSNLSGNIITALIIFLLLMKYVGKVRISIPKFDKVTVAILKGCGVTFLVVVVQQLYILSRNFFASFLEEGAISSLYYAGFITGIISMIVYMSAFNLLLNHLTHSFTNEIRIKTKQFFISAVLTFFSVVIPAVIIFILFNEEIVRIIYMRGNFSNADVSKTIQPFFWESLALLNYIVHITFTALYLAKKEYKLLTYVGIPMFALGILANFVLSKVFGYYGISISNFIITLFYACLLVWNSRKFIGSIKEFTVLILKISCSAFAVYLISYYLKYYLAVKLNFSNKFMSDIANTLLYSVFVLLIFYLLTYFLKVNYLKNIKSLIKR